MNEWISIKIRKKPKSGQAIDLWTSQGWRIANCFYSISGKYFYKYGMKGEIEKIDRVITHWIPLPEPPKDLNET